MTSRIRQLLWSKAVPNNGSQLRDHQANERTFLSWTRMGLAFAAMALALGRLGLIDHLAKAHFQPQRQTEGIESQSLLPETTAGSSEKHDSANNQVVESHELIASRACWTISVWSFGYGLFRYVSVRQNLLHGRFTPALWGPIMMTGGSLGTLGVIFWPELRVRKST